MTCNKEDLTAIYSERPVFELTSCSLISSYQFMGKSSKNHALLLSGNNPALLTNFGEGLEIEVRHVVNSLPYHSFINTRSAKKLGAISFRSFPRI